MRKQAGGAAKIIVRLFRDDPLQIGYRSGKVAHLNRADATPVKRVRCVRAGCDRSIECLARLGNLAIVHVEIAQLFVVSRRWIVANDGFELADALTAGKDFQALADQPKVRCRLHEQEDHRTEWNEQDNPYPVVVRASPNKV